MRVGLMLAVIAGLICMGCGSDDDAGDHSGEHSHQGAGHTAEAMIAPKSGNMTLAGSAKFSGEKGSVQVMLAVTGAPPGVHGAHIHETGDCSAPDAMSAGGHWNPQMHMHSMPGAMAHLGDMGNLTVDAAGSGTLTLTNAAWEVGTGTPMDVIGKAVIIHAMPDDFATQPTGNAGGRIGCGVIQ